MQNEHKHTHTHIHTHICRNTHKHTRTQICAHTHTHTHTHIYTLVRFFVGLELIFPPPDRFTKMGVTPSLRLPFLPSSLFSLSPPPPSSPLLSVSLFSPLHYSLSLLLHLPPSLLSF